MKSDFYDNSFFYDHLKTPIGLLQVTATDKEVVSILFVEDTQLIHSNLVTIKALNQLNEYFNGERLSFDLPLLSQGTNFQKKVWQALTEIEYADTCSYSDIACNINNPKGVRAVGLANGKNPMTIVVPCHRVIGKNGQLTGYAGGVDRKAWLLAHEQRIVAS